MQTYNLEYLAPLQFQTWSPYKSPWFHPILETGDDHRLKFLRSLRNIKSKKNWPFLISYPLKSYGWVLVNYRIHSGLFVRFSIKFEFFQRYLMIQSVRPGTWAWQKCFQSQKQLNSTFANICSLLCLSVIKTPQTAENQLFHISTIIEWVIIEFFIIYRVSHKKLYLVLEGCSTTKFWARNKSWGCFGILRFSALKCI